MLVKPLKTKDEIIGEVLTQLSRFMMSENHTIDWLENESRLETEYPISNLAAQAGYDSTADFLHEEFNGYVEFVGRGYIKAGSKLYDTPELEHIVSLQARTEPKDRKGRGAGYKGRGGGRAGTSNSNYYPQASNNHATAYQNRQKHQPSNYSSQTNFQQEKRRSPSPARKYSPPSQPHEEQRRLSPRVLFENSAQPLPAKSTNFVQSSSIKSPPSTIIIGPPPGFEKPQRQIVIDSPKAYGDVSTSDCTTLKNSSDDDPFSVKAAKIVNAVSSNKLSLEHRIPPDPRNARFEDSENGQISFDSPPGYGNPQDIEIKESNECDSDGEDEEFFDALEEQPIKLPPCLTFTDLEKRDYKPPIHHPDIKATIPKFIEAPMDKYDTIEDDNYLNYFVNVITAIHYNIPSKSEALFYEVIKNLPERVSHRPGFDACSLYSVIKALGPSFIHFIEEYSAEDGITLFYIKNVNRGMKKDEYRMILRSTLSFLMPLLPIPIIVNGIKVIKAVVYEARNGNYSYFVKAPSTKGQEKKMTEMLRKAKTINLVNPYPRALCIYYHNRVPYRAQIIAQIDSKKVNVELVDAGEFLTVTIDQLKVAELEEIATIPRFAIPCRLEDDKKLNLRISLDGFERRSTSKSIPMYFTQKNNKNYVSIKLF